MVGVILCDINELRELEHSDIVTIQAASLLARALWARGKKGTRLPRDLTISVIVRLEGVWGIDQRVRGRAPLGP